MAQRARVLYAKTKHADRKLTKLLDESVKRTIDEDPKDRPVVETRDKEPVVSLESVLKETKRRGKV